MQCTSHFCIEILDAATVISEMSAWAVQCVFMFVCVYTDARLFVDSANVVSQRQVSLIFLEVCICGTLKSSLACKMKYRSKVVSWLSSLPFFFPCGMRCVYFSGSGFEDNVYTMCTVLFVCLEPFVYIHEGLLTDGMCLMLTVFAW